MNASLVHIDPTCNMRRFWSVSQRRAVATRGTAVVVQWGRLGTTGNELIHTFDTKADADAWTTRTINSKLNKGYV